MYAHVSDTKSKAPHIDETWGLTTPSFKAFGPGIRDILSSQVYEELTRQSVMLPGKVLDLIG